MENTQTFFKKYEGKSTLIYAECVNLGPGVRQKDLKKLVQALQTMTFCF